MSGDLPFLPLGLPYPVTLSPQAAGSPPVVYKMAAGAPGITSLSFSLNLKLIGQDGCGMGSRNSMSPGLPFIRVTGLLSISGAIRGKEA